VVYGAPAYLARHGAPASPAQRVRHNCRRCSQGTRTGMWLVRDTLLDALRRLPGDCEASTGNAVRIAVLTGHSLVQRPRCRVRDDLARGALHPTLDTSAPSSIPLFVVYAHREILATVRVFVELQERRFNIGA
jgi:DNA-binding transcriptional LysR family regulator